MKVRSRCLVSLLMALFMVVGMAMPMASASKEETYEDEVAPWTDIKGSIKCYTLGTGNTTTYTTKDLTNKSGYVDGADEIIVKIIGRNSKKDWYALINYKVNSGGTKDAYVYLSAITASTTAGVEKRAGAKISDIYSRPGTKYPGKSFIAKGDDIYVMKKTSNGYTQILYPISNGWKFAWIKTKIAQHNLVSKQENSSWSDHPYGYANGKSATIGSGGCGVMSIVNAVYYLNGQLVNPGKLARFSVDEKFRINDQGTDEGLVKAFCDDASEVYKIKFNKNIKRQGSASDTLNEVKGDLLAGDTAVLHVQGHFIALVAYDADKEQYLIYDSAVSNSWGGKSGMRWLSASDFSRDLAITDTDACIQVITKR